MSTPHDPDDNAARLEAEEAAWRSIVDNYGDRPEVEEPEIVLPPSLRDLDGPAGPRSSVPGEDLGDERDADPDPADHFVPPAPPPLPTASPARLLAWVGLFGVPLFVLVALVTGLVLPSWLGLLFMVWFVGGFLFLIASMRPPSDHDDGAVL